MTPEEREQLRRDLEAAGCKWLSAAATSLLGEAYLLELRSLLRRPTEVWVVNSRAMGYVLALRSSRAAAESVAREHGWWGYEITQHTIDAEVPDDSV